MSFRPGWDRQDRRSLRFLDPTLEDQYRDSITGLARQRQLVAIAIGGPLWLIAPIVGPPLLGIALLPLATAAIVNVAVQGLIVWLLRRPVPLSWVWSATVTLTALSAAGIVIGLGGAFADAGAAAFMTSAVTAIALVRPPSWVAAAMAGLHPLLYVAMIVATAAPITTFFQLFLLIGTMAVTYAGARYIEDAERNSFAQRLLIADLHRRIDRLFRQYLSPDVAQALVDNPDRAELGGEVVEITVLFADLRGYTAYSERRAPAEVVAMLNRAFGSAVPAVFAEGGTVVQFVGDALMAIFNAPLRQPDHALRACRAALDLQRLESLGSSTDEHPRFRVGINSGPALVGNIGSAELRNFSALGDTTNVAARLQTYAEEGTVVLGQRTYELVRHVAEVRSLGTADLKGKSSPTPVYQLVGLSGD